MLLAVLGDSLTWGFPFGEETSWLSVMAHRLGVQAFNHGICGDTTADMRGRLNGALAHKDLTHFIIFGGANDLLLGRPAEYILRDLCYIGQQALAKGLKTGCVLPLIPADAAYAREFVDMREQIKQAAWPDVRLIDLSPVLREEDGHINYLDDGVHLSVAGNNALGAYAAGSLEDWLRMG